MERILQQVEKSEIAVQKVWFSDSHIFVQMQDGRIIGHPLAWYPKLKSANLELLSDFELWSCGKWIHWEKLDEDLSAEGFLKFSGN